jgi:hypothetical protein
MRLDQQSSGLVSSMGIFDADPDSALDAGRVSANFDQDFTGSSPGPD